jgi:restriction system protein
MKFYRIILGKGNEYRKLAKTEGFIGIDFGVKKDLLNIKDILNIVKNILEKIRPEQTVGGRGKSANTFVRFIETIQNGDLVFIDNGNQGYDIFEIVGNYYYKENNLLPHRRNVSYVRTIDKNKFPERIINSFGNVNTLTGINAIDEENMINAVLSGKTTGDKIFKEIIQDEERQSFIIEKDLERFIVGNWNSIKDLSGYKVYEEDGEIVGQQYDTEEVGIIDILAVNTKQKKLLIIEIKRKTTDEVVGQILRYMGYVKKNIALELGYEVEGLIVSEKLSENHKAKIDYALDLLPTIKHKSYSIKFDLE